MQISVQLARYLVLTLAALSVLVAASMGGAAAQDSFSRTVGGLTGYLGVMPAELSKGPPSHIPEPGTSRAVPMSFT
jgi:hypothetical protein